VLVIVLARGCHWAIRDDLAMLLQLGAIRPRG
jgi:hypothetical protein